MALPLVVLLACAAAFGGPEQPTGNWKISFLDGADLVNLGLLKLEGKEGKLAGAFDVTPEVVRGGAKVALQKVSLENGTLKLTVDLGNQPLHFAFQVPKGETKRLRGSMTIGQGVLPAQLEATKDDSAKDYELAVEVKVPRNDFKEIKEDVAKRTDDLRVFAYSHGMLDAAANGKVPAADLRAALAPVFKAARNFGDWHKELLLLYARHLGSNDNFAQLSEEFAQAALKEFGSGADLAIQLRCLDSHRPQPWQTRQEGRPGQGSLPHRRPGAKGLRRERKSRPGLHAPKVRRPQGQTSRLGGVFTGAHCPPCVAADMAFEGLAKTYGTPEVVLLQYHLHIPAPDPLTTPETEDRAKYYGDDVRGTPSIFFNGKTAAGGGGPRMAHSAKYKEYRNVIEPLLANENEITLTVDAKRAGDRIAVAATAGGYKPADKLKLRLALIEPWVRFAGTNGLSYHAHVVRALPGGIAGIALAKANAKETAIVDLAAVRQSASKHLDEIPFLEGQRPFSYRNLRVVAFIQDDETKDVLHAVDVPVK